MKDQKIRRMYDEDAFGDCAECQLTAKLKAGIVADWERFVVWRAGATPAEVEAARPGPGGAPPKFTKRLYHAFSLYLGHIAHYNIHGFFDCQMAQDRDFNRNLREALVQDRNHYNTWGAHHDAGDLHKAMQVVAESYWNDWQAVLTARLVELEREQEQQMVATLEGKGYKVTR